MNELILLLAQATSEQTTGGAGGTGAPDDSFWRYMFPILLAMLIFYIFLFRGQRKDRQKHTSMLSNLKRNDRVETIGGVLGTVVDARDTEVVLKVDETNNVKLRFSRGAIKNVLSVAEADK